MSLLLRKISIIKDSSNDYILFYKQEISINTDEIRIKAR
jgi:hypothetical protein